jgi:hypothetical protein
MTSPFSSVNVRAEDFPHRNLNGEGNPGLESFMKQAGSVGQAMPMGGMVPAPRAVHTEE